MTRPGIALYGYPPPHCEGVVQPPARSDGQDHGWPSSALPQAETVGYGSAWTAPIDTLGGDARGWIREVSTAAMATRDWCW